LHLGLSVIASFRGERVLMDSLILVCGSGCRKQISSTEETASVPETPTAREELVEIVRFAKHGHAAFEPKGIASTGILIMNAIRRIRAFLSKGTFRSFGATWLVHMEDGFPLVGQFVRNGSSGGVLRLGGRMVMTIQPDRSANPLRLRSRKEPILEGPVEAWPPRGSVLRLVNSPIEYFVESEVDIPSATPVLVVEANTVTFDSNSVALLEAFPAITRLFHIRDETSGRPAVTVEWRDVRQEVAAAGDPPVTHYNVYRSLRND